MSTRHTPPESAPLPAKKPRGGLVGLVRKLLFGHVRLARDGGALRLSLEERRAAPVVAAPEPTAATAGPPTDAGAVVQRAALKTLLDARPDSRHALPHLRYLESALGRQGAQAIVATPAPVLQKIMVQLDGLNTMAHPALLQLQQQISNELDRRGAHPAERTLPFDVSPSDYRAGDKLQVGEAHLSDFLRESDRVGAS
ncbi:hypothetical protein HLB44_24315 [Aquincola sp. S2]|uniref:Uncharacterized protein n=1 Tax=Pseudaquabacterium terrae TaxID=2732868 RepID=A0ABX2ENM2_9BURK|nr:hypothetical protein [Aquabacterium terrae]NRF70136.1 hypothetical protein [Aquabacterium terrae]